MEHEVDINQSMIDQGIPRSYLLARLSQDMRLVLARGQAAERRFYQETEEPEMVTKVNLQETLDKLKTCPICQADLVMPVEYPQERTCSSGCGDFTITELDWSGVVLFEFKAVLFYDEPKKQEQSDNDGPHDGIRYLSGGSMSVPDSGAVPE